MNTSKDNKLTLKEAGRYANTLKKHIDDIIMLPHFGLEGKMYTTTELHKRKASYKEAEDETIIVEYDGNIDVEISDLDNVLFTLLEEKAKLAEAISEGKKGIKLVVEGEDITRNLDSAIEYAKTLRRISQSYFEAFINLRDSKRKSQGKAYGMNVEGNQMPYYYEIETVTTLNYDKDKYVEKDKEIKIKADRISEAIERASTEPSIEFVPKFNYLDSLEDVVSKVIKE